jgi:hypothetical protein
VSVGLNERRACSNEIPSRAVNVRQQASWRSDKADEHDDDRNTRSGLALLDAAEDVEQLPDDDPRLLRLVQAQCLGTTDVFVGGEELGHVVRLYHFHGRTGSPSQFLDDLAAAAERDAAELGEEE